MAQFVLRNLNKERYPWVQNRRSQAASGFAKRNDLRKHILIRGNRHRILWTGRSELESHIDPKFAAGPGCRFFADYDEIGELAPRRFYTTRSQEEFAVRSKIALNVFVLHAWLEHAVSACQRVTIGRFAKGFGGFGRLFTILPTRIESESMKKVASGIMCFRAMVQCY